MADGKPDPKAGVTQGASQEPNQSNYILASKIQREQMSQESKGWSY